jgi:hypothetical protein
MEVTIHSHNNQWAGAQIVSVGKDSFTGEQDVFIVHHPEFERDTEYYVQPDEQGRCLNVGNNAYWITRG